MRYIVGDIVRIKSYSELKKNKRWLGWYKSAIKIEDNWPKMLGNAYQINSITVRDDTDMYYLDCPYTNDNIPWFEYELMSMRRYTIYGEKYENQIYKKQKWTH